MGVGLFRTYHLWLSMFSLVFICVVTSIIIKNVSFNSMYFSYPIRVKTSGAEHTLGTNSCEKGKRKKKKYILCTIEEDINNNQLIQERF